MRILTGALITETNTFSPIPTGWTAFERTPVQRGAQAPFEATWEFAPLVRWRELAQADGHTAIESIAAVAEPGGRTVRAVYETLRDEILRSVREALPLDVVLLYLHGAMAAEGYDDCEGDILARCREIVGPDVVIGAELDLHGNVTQTMLDAATAIVAYKEYPHTDMVDRAADLYRICVDAAGGKTKPVMAMHDCRHGRPVADVRPADAGASRRCDGCRTQRRAVGQLDARFSVGRRRRLRRQSTRDRRRQPANAKETAERFGLRFWDVRERAHVQSATMDEAIDLALAARGRSRWSSRTFRITPAAALPATVRFCCAACSSAA